MQLTPRFRDADPRPSFARQAAEGHHPKKASTPVAATPSLTPNPWRDTAAQPFPLPVSSVMQMASDPDHSMVVSRWRPLLGQLCVDLKGDPW